MGSNLVEVVKGVAIGVAAGTRAVVHEAIPEEFRLPEKLPKRQQREYLQPPVNPLRQAIADSQRLAEVRQSLSAFIPQGEGKHKENPRVVSKPAIRLASVVRNRG